jgi:hypothetical protein
VALAYTRRYALFTLELPEMTTSKRPISMPPVSAAAKLKTGLNGGQSIPGHGQRIVSNPAKPIHLIPLGRSAPVTTDCEP